MKQGKRYAEVAKAVDRQVKYAELDAIQLVKKALSDSTPPDKPFGGVISWHVK